MRHYRELIAYSAGWTDHANQRAVGNSGRDGPRQLDSIIDAELRAAVCTPRLPAARKIRDNATATRPVANRSRQPDAARISGPGSLDGSRPAPATARVPHRGDCRAWRAIGIVAKRKLAPAPSECWIVAIAMARRQAAGR